MSIDTTFLRRCNASPERAVEGTPWFASNRQAGPTRQTCRPEESPTSFPVYEPLSAGAGVPERRPLALASQDLDPSFAPDCVLHEGVR